MSTFDSTHSDLCEWIEQLEDYLSAFCTYSVAGMFSSAWMSGVHHLHDDWGLESPLRQTFYLLGLLMKSPEPVGAREFGQSEMKIACELLSTIYEYYAWQYFKDPVESNVSEAEWRTKIELAMPVFLDYFNRARIMGTNEQVCSKIAKCFVKFDNELEELLGISASDTLKILEWVSINLQLTLDNVTTSYAEVEAIRQQFLEIAKRDSFDAAEKFMKSTPVLKVTTRFSILLNSMFSIFKDDIAAHFGHDLADRFWNLTVSVRPVEQGIKYPTDQNVAEMKAFFQYAPGKAICPVLNSVSSGILCSFESVLESSKHATKYYRHRDKTLEIETASELLKLFHQPPIVFRGAYEQPNSQFEHDLILVDGDTVLVVECKASRIREPLRDISKTYERMRDSFRAPSGIQKAYEQGNRVRRRLSNGEDVTLFNKHGKDIGIIRAENVRRCFVLCVTAESWGYMATDLSYFLKKSVIDPYPWCVNVLDLSLFIEALTIREWGPIEFYRYLEERAPLHGIAKSEDELAFAGAFLQNGYLPFEPAPDTRYQLANDYANIFDEIWLSKQTGKKIVFKPGAVMIDMRRAVGIPGATVPLRWHPERRCFCGSGRKYKNCCLKDGIITPPVKKNRSRIKGP